MRIISATTRLTIGLVCISASVWLIAFTLGMWPDRQGAVLDGRIALCENAAWNCSLLASRSDQRSMEMALQGLVQRNAEVLSAAIRRPNGELLVQAGPHPKLWSLQSGTQSTASQMRVPLLANGVDWGALEVRFQDLPPSGVGLSRTHPLLLLGLFVASASYLMFFFYMSKMLQHMDPSKVIPRRVRQTLDTLAEGLLVLDNSERILLANQAFSKSIGTSVHQLIGRKASDLPWETDEKRMKTEGFPWQRALHDDAYPVGDLMTIVDKNNQRRTMKINAIPVYGDDGQRRGAMASFDDVTELEKNRVQLRIMLDSLSESRDEIHRHNLELERIAAHDPLTDCLNRRAFFTQFESHWSLIEQHDYTAACIMFDLDHFKLINDNHGHQAGDKVLEMTSHLLRANSREDDLVCRYGGEEFCIFLPQTDIDAAFSIAEGLRKSVEAHDFDGLAVTASVGVSARSLGARSPQEMIDQADKCLYVAKRDGRNQVVRFDRATDRIAAFELHGETPMLPRVESKVTIDEPLFAK